MPFQAPIFVSPLPPAVNPPVAGNLYTKSGYALLDALIGKGRFARGDAYSAAVLADNPLTYYRMDAGSGTIEQDQGSLQLDGTYINAPTLGATGAVKGDASVTFSKAAGQRLQGADADGYSIVTTGALTIEFWALRNTIPSSGTFENFIIKSAIGNGEYTAEVNDTGMQSFTIRDPVNAGTWITWADFGRPALGVWHHYVATMQNVAGTVTLNVYLDGVLVGTTTFALSAVANGTGLFVVAGSNLMDGNMDEIAIYGTALSQSRITAHYNATGYLLKRNYAITGTIGSGAKGGNTYTKSGYAVSGLVGSGASQILRPPITAVLDNFNRANGSLGSNWIVVGGGFEPLISSNQLVEGGGGYAFWKAPNGGPTSEVYATVAAVAQFYLFLNYGTPDGTGGSGYRLNFNSLGGGSYQAIISRMDAGVETILGGSSGFTPSNGDTILLRRSAVGTLDVIWNHAGVYQLVLTRTDTTYTTGYIGVQPYDTGIALDDFGGGPLVYSKSGYATCGGLIGSGPSASITQETGFAIAGGLIGTGADVDIDVDTGFATVGGIGSSPKQVTHSKSGYAIAGGLIGSGADTILLNETGFATVGGIGSGPSASITQETGSGIAGGLVGSGADVDIDVDTGFAIAGGLVGSGPSASITQETGFGTVGGVGAGGKALTYTKTGYAICGGVGSGTRQQDHNRTGYATVGCIGAGSETFVSGAGTVYSKAGNATVGCIGSGVEAYTLNKSGYATIGGVGSGSKQVTHSKSGYAVSGGLVGTGADVDIDVDTGFATVGGVGSAPSASITQETGFATVGGVGAGPSESLTQETGFATVGGVGAGPSASITQETGFAQVGINASGFDTWILNKTGFGKVGINGAGSSAKAGTIIKTGYATCGGVGSGVRNSIGNKTGRAIVGTIGSGSRAIEHNRSGYATAGGIGSGPSASVTQETGFATIGGVGSGPSASVTQESGFATVGGVGSGSELKGGSATKAGHGVVGCLGAGSKSRVFTKSGYAIAGSIGSGAYYHTFVIGNNLTLNYNVTGRIHADLTIIYNVLIGHEVSPIGYIIPRPHAVGVLTEGARAFAVITQTVGTTIVEPPEAGAIITRQKGEGVLV